MNTSANSRKGCAAGEVRYNNLNWLRNKSEDFDEESCIVDGDDLNSNTELKKILSMSYKFYIYNAAFIVHQ